MTLSAHHQATDSTHIENTLIACLCRAEGHKSWPFHGKRDQKTENGSRKSEVCKTFTRRFDPDPRLQQLTDNFLAKSATCGGFHV